MSQQTNSTKLSWSSLESSCSVEVLNESNNAKTRSSTSSIDKELINDLESKNDDEILQLLHDGIISHYKLEQILQFDVCRSIRIRRKYIQQLINYSNNLMETDCSVNTIDNIPFLDNNYIDNTKNTNDILEIFYNQIYNVNCENVIGHIPIPVGIVGALEIDKKFYYIPMATTEGALIASCNRGTRAISLSNTGGVSTILVDDFMTRSPCIDCDNIQHALMIKEWIECSDANLNILINAFEETTNYGKFKSIKIKIIDKLLYLRISCSTGDAMGMNMISKGCIEIVNKLRFYFPTIKLISLSSNFCTDKKSSALNWIDGRGKNVIAECIVKNSIIHEVLKSDIDSIINVNLKKNLIGSIAATTIGGNNAHASNMVTAIFLASKLFS